MPERMPRAQPSVTLGSTLSSDAGVLELREVDGRLGLAERLARCLDDPRDPALITHSASDISASAC